MERGWIFAVAVVLLVFSGDILSHLSSVWQHEAPSESAIEAVEVTRPSIEQVLAARSTDKRVYISFCSA